MISAGIDGFEDRNSGINTGGAVVLSAQPIPRDVNTTAKHNRRRIVDGECKVSTIGTVTVL